MYDILCCDRVTSICIAVVPQPQGSEAHNHTSMQRLLGCCNTNISELDQESGCDMADRIGNVRCRRKSFDCIQSKHTHGPGDCYTLIN
jgi:hypothetical protein